MQSIASYIVAIMLPGAWIVFGPTLSGMKFLTRVIFGFVLSPIVIFIQFYLFRVAGLTFEQSAYAIPIANLPVLYFFYKRFQLPNRQAFFDLLKFLAVFSVPLIFLVIKFADVQLVAYTGHGWLHSDSIYSLSNSFLVPDEAELAGAAHAYPWAGNLYQGVLSYLIDSPPVADYPITNVLWLAALLLLGTMVVKSLGGDKFAELTSVIWLCFGVNVVGYMLTVKPLNYIRWFRDSGVWGFDAYSPWVEKYFFFSFMPIGLCLYGAAVYLLTLGPKSPLSSGVRIGITGILASGLSLFYPILYPAMLGLIGAAGVVILLDKGIAKPNKQTQLLGLIAITVLSGALTYFHLYVLSLDRVNQNVTVSSAEYFVTKLIRTIIVLSPLLLGAVVAFTYAWRQNRNGTAILLLGGLACGFLHCIFSLSGGGNEYKYIFTAAICLAPFPALALQQLFTNRKNWRIMVFLVITVVLVAPLAHKMRYKGWGLRYPVPGYRPALDLSSYDLKLAKSETTWEVYETIRQKTSPETILVILQSDIHIPTLTQRSLYVSPFRKNSRVGVGMPVDRTLKQVKGFDPVIIEARRETVRRLFRARTRRNVETQLTHILNLGRPVAIIMVNSSDSELVRLVSDTELGRMLYLDDKNTVWYITDKAESGAVGFDAPNEK